MKSKLYKQNSKCLIVQSKFSEFSFWNYTEVCEIAGAKYPAAPLGLLTVAAHLPQHWEFKLIDENVQPLTDSHFQWADVIVTGGMLPQQKGILSIISNANKNLIPVIVGGPDPTGQPDVYKDADYRVLGEGEVTIPLFLEALKKGLKSGTFQSKELADMTTSKVPRFDLINFKDYIQVGIQYSRGCPFVCEFCDIIELYGRKPRTKSSEQILQELNTLYDLGYRGHVDFVDDNFIGNKKNVKQILPVIEQWSKEHKFPFYFSTEASINLADDEELMEMMRAVDFRYLFIGIETPDDELLREMQKKQNVNKPLTEMILKIYEYGMVVNAGFIMGFDNEKPTIAGDMINLIQNTGIPMAMVGTLYALPLTQLTKRLRKEGRLYEEGSTPDDETGIDQLTSGLNFVTKRPRLNILRDYTKVVETIYHPKNYFNRVLYASLNLKQSTKHKPAFGKIFQNLTSFLKICKKLGFNNDTGTAYWKMILYLLFRKPGSLEVAINLAAIYIHFFKQSRFLVGLMQDKIKDVEKYGENKYNDMMSEPKPRHQQAGAR